jgi:glycosyltransferase involved in cell wall biosynthesis
VTALGVVVIGRNEAERLPDCLQSMGGQTPVVYVDSGSDDNSSEIARTHGAIVIQLDMSMPFTAARGRNTGLARLLESYPEIKYVQFVDGDCELAGRWLEHGLDALNENTRIAAVCGRLREKFPSRSIYNRLCDMEWDGGAGEIKSCGGIAMYRVSCLREVGGFDATIRAGEEPELCMRLREKDWIIVRLNHEMAVHDAAMFRFSQWWARALRGGYGGLDVVRRFDKSNATSFPRQLKSARMWALGWPALVLAAALIGSLHSLATAIALASLAFALLPVQILRLTFRAKRRPLPLATAFLYAAMTMLSKWANLAGQWRYFRTAGSTPNPEPPNAVSVNAQ